MGPLQFVEKDGVAKATEGASAGNGVLVCAEPIRDCTVLARGSRYTPSPLSCDGRTLVLLGIQLNP